MRHLRKSQKIYSEMGKRSQVVQENKRLAAALEYGQVRAVDSIPVFEIRTRNPRVWARASVGDKT